MNQGKYALKRLSPDLGCDQDGKLRSGRQQQRRLHLGGATVSMVSADRFMESLTRSPLAHVRAITGPVRGDWHTQPRTPKNIYAVHYLFCSPYAAMRSTVDGNVTNHAANTLLWMSPGHAYELYAMQSPQQR